MTHQNLLEQVGKIAEKFPAVKLGYFFGSAAKGGAGPLSDHDFAFYLDGCDNAQMTEIRLKLMDEISRLIKSDKIDVVILNQVKAAELAYNIIAEGKLFYEIEPFRVIVEPRIMNLYFDFREILRKHELTKT